MSLGVAQPAASASAHAYRKTRGFLVKRIILLFVLFIGLGWVLGLAWGLAWSVWGAERVQFYSPVVGPFLRGRGEWGAAPAPFLGARACATVRQLARSACHLAPVQE